MKHIQKTSFLSLFVCATITLTACDTDSKRPKRFSGDERTSPSVNDELDIDTESAPISTKSENAGTIDVDTEEVREVAGPSGIKETFTSVGFRSFDQLNYTMAALTGVNAHANTNVASAFVELRGQLPSNNNIREFTPAKGSAILKLGATYCDEMVRDQALRTQVLPQINFAVGPSQSLANPTVLADALFKAFWGDNLATLPDLAKNRQLVVELINQVKAGKPDTPASTVNVTMGICTAVIASAPVTTY